MLRIAILGFALVAGITATAVVGTTAATLALTRASATTTITKIPAAPQAPTRTVGRFEKLS